MDEQIVPSVSRGELTTIIRRLEAATSRLEDIAAATLESPTSSSETNITTGAPTVAPTGPVPPPPPPASQPTAPKPVIESTPPAVEDFDGFLSGALKKYVVLSDELGGAIAEQVKITYSCSSHIKSNVYVGDTRQESIRSSAQVSSDHHKS